MCGITGVLCGPDSPSNAAVALIYDALLALQHRGQDAAGIVTEDTGRLCLRKDMGMVRDVFTPDHILNLRGDMGIGHVRCAAPPPCTRAYPLPHPAAPSHTHTHRPPLAPLAA